MDDVISRYANALLNSFVCVAELIIARVVIKEVIGNRTPPFVNLHAHPNLVAIVRDGVVVIIKEIRFNNFQS